jgi:hypothetical protein
MDAVVLVCMIGRTFALLQLLARKETLPAMDKKMQETLV